MELLTIRNLNGVQLDCYKAENEFDGFWATREQIGTLLGYSDPVNSIMKIHTRNANRLDKFSTWVKLSQVEGDRTVTREVIVYNFKGFLEICRYSNQPKAEAVIDFAWSIMDEIYRTGSYNGKIEAAKILLQTLEKPVCKLNESDKQKIFSKAVNLLGGVQLDEHFYSCKDIAKELCITEKRVFNKALNAGIIKSGNNIYGFWDDNCEWFFNELGHEKVLEYYETWL